jgi:carboxymethylenebutenolidase
VTGPIRRAAALLAGHGFVVVVPEIFHELEGPGTVLPYDQAGADRGNADKINKELSSYDADAKAAVSYLKSHPQCTGKIGSMGFCIGGHLAFRSATNPEVLAATCCYPTDIHKRSLGKGLNDNTLDRIPEIRGELLVVFGRQDPHVPREGRATIYKCTGRRWNKFQLARIQRRPRIHAGRRRSIRRCRRTDGLRNGAGPVPAQARRRRPLANSRLHRDTPLGAPRGAR